MTTRDRDNEKRSMYSLDPAKDKENIEHNIAHSIEEQVRGLDDAAVQAAVKDKYEELLGKAKVRQHIPTLTEGVVRGNFRHQKLEKKKQ